MARRTLTVTPEAVEVRWEWRACTLCEGIGLVEKMGPAGVPHLVSCPPCDGTGTQRRAVATFTLPRGSQVEVLLGGEQWEALAGAVEANRHDPEP